MAKITELSDGGSLQSTDYLIAVRSGGNVKVQADGNLSLGTVTANGLTVQGTATTRPTIGNSDVNTSGLTTGLNFEPISNIGNGAKLNVISGLQPTVASAYTAGFEFVTEDHSGGGSFAQTKALTIGASGDISFYDSTGVSQSLFWDASAESLGIGTSSPNTPLQVSGANSSTNADALFSVQKTTEGYGLFSGVLATGVSWLQGGTSDDVTYYNLALQPNGGQVGIGTPSPGQELHVQSGTGTEADIRIAGNGGASSYMDLFHNASGAGVWNASNTPLQFATNSLERMRIDSSGNVGIGTASPEALLSLSKTTAGGEGGYIYIDNPATSTLDSKSGIKFGTSAGASFASTPTGEITNVVTDAGSGASALTFGTFNGTASGERMRIDSSGRVGIGTGATIATPATLQLRDTAPHLYIVSDDGSSAKLLFGDASDDSRGGFEYTSTDNLIFTTNNLSEAMRIDASGNVGIGTTSPNTPLQVSGANSSTNADALFSVQKTTEGYGLFSGVLATGVSWLQGGTSDDVTYYNLALQPNGGNVGIGTDSPATQTHIQGSNAVTASAGLLYITADSAAQNNGGQISLGTSSARHAAIAGRQESTGGSAGYLQLSTRGSSGDITERMRIDSSGNLLVGTTDTTPWDNSTATSADDGIFLGGGRLGLAKWGGVPLLVNRTDSDGEIAIFYKDGSPVGSIGTSSDIMYIGSSEVNLLFGGDFAIPAIAPCDSAGAARDNAIDLGFATSGRFNDAYITNGVTTGSDANDKQDIETLSDAEQRVAVACKGLLRKWRWKDAVEAKGDEARIHFGIIAQDLQAAFEAEGLDAGRYAMFMSNTWTDEETGEERTRLGVRYHELLAFIIAAI